MTRLAAMTLHLSKTCAAWLIALIILPFTAPLSTCDLADFFGLGMSHMQGPLSKMPSARSLTQAEINHALPVRPTAPRRIAAIDRLPTNRLDTNTPRPPFSRMTSPGSTHSLRPARSLVLRI
jgi:hypothetical protein